MTAVTVLQAMPWWAWISIVAIVCGAVTQVLKMQHAHAERIEMIRQGINPDGGKPGGPREV